VYVYRAGTRDSEQNLTGDQDNRLTSPRRDQPLTAAGQQSTGWEWLWDGLFGRDTSEHWPAVDWRSNQDRDPHPAAGAIPYHRRS
jgi:hypothetical protein